VAHNSVRDNSPSVPAPPIITDDQIAAMTCTLAFRRHSAIDPTTAHPHPVDAGDAIRMTENWRRHPH
jgi:hypothetical protein